jgi:hypothetical protein
MVSLHQSRERKKGTANNHACILVHTDLNPLTNMHDRSSMMNEAFYILDSGEDNIYNNRDSDHPIIQLNKTKWTPSFQHKEIKGTSSSVVFR